jgi:hypothetical protein
MSDNMNNNTIDGKEQLMDEIKSAINKCNELEEPQKSIFKTILEVLQYITTNNKLSVIEVNKQETKSVNVPEYVEKLIKATKINLNDLELIFDFEEENLELVANITGESEKDKQFKATLCILTALNFCFGKKEITSTDLVKQLEDLGIGSLSNLSSYLSTFKQFVKVDGKTRKYKIKGPGIKRGKEIIKELVLEAKEGQ